MNGRRRHGRHALLVALAAGVAMAGGRGIPAQAHEFVLVAVAPTEASDARAGFQVAIDESPDVTHPPGQEAGDHLGGVDVEVITVESSVEGASTPQRVEELLDRGASAVVVLAETPFAAGVANAAADRDKLAVLIAPADWDSLPAGVILLRPRHEPANSATEAFNERFVAEYGRTPRNEAARGYDVGRLLESLVADAGEDLAPRTQLVAAARSAGGLVASRVEVVGPAARDRRRDGAAFAVTAGVAVAVVLGAAGAAGVLWNRKRH